MFRRNWPKNKKPDDYKLLTSRLFGISGGKDSEQIKDDEQDDPDAIDEVPVEADFLHHLVVLAAFEYALDHHDENDDVDDHT